MTAGTFSAIPPQRRASFEAYLEGVAQGVKDFLQKEDFFPVLIGMERLDEKACKRLETLLSLPHALFLSGKERAAVMTGVLRNLSALVTSRYHAAVLSMEGACPIVGVSMDERLDGILRELSLDDRFLLHVSEEGLGRKLGQALEEAWEERKEIQEHIQRSVVDYKAALGEMGKFLKEYLTVPVQG